MPQCMVIIQAMLVIKPIIGRIRSNVCHWLLLVAEIMVAIAAIIPIDIATLIVITFCILERCCRYSLTAISYCLIKYRLDCKFQVLFRHAFLIFGKKYSKWWTICSFSSFSNLACIILSFLRSCTSCCCVVRRKAELPKSQTNAYTK